MKTEHGVSKTAAVDQLTPQEIAGVIRRDRKHLASFCVRVIPLYRAVAHARLMALSQYSPAKQEDLVQSLMEATLREDIVSKWNPSLGLLSTYLRVFAKRRAQDILESKAIRSCEKLMEEAALAAASDKADPEETLSTEDLLLWKQLQRQILASPDREYVELFQLHFLQGYSPEELAARFGKDVQTIYKRIQRMRKDVLSLRDRLLAK
ncbi:MAG: sigma-70 family RNA polymerase sigma factor [Myxococcales bacterium]|nr:sigma-70 family RNA polymerase sigma factor [Myxococcales bacterium]